MTETPFSRRLRERMAELELSQAEIARELFGEATEKRTDRNGNVYETTVARNRAAVSQWCRSVSIPGPKNAAKLAKFLRTTPEYLLTGDRGAPPPLMGEVTDHGMVQLKIDERVPAYIARAIMQLLEGARRA